MEKNKSIVLAALLLITAAVLGYSWFVKPIELTKQPNPNIVTLPKTMAEVQKLVPNVVDEAQTQIDDEPHQRRISQAKRLLKKKAELTAELNKVNKKLTDLAEGKEVDDYGSLIISGSSAGWTTVIPNN